MQYQVTNLSRGALALLATSIIAGCHDSDSNEPLPIIDNSTNIQWTSYGVPHISAKNYTDLGEGLGYVMAQDKMCNVLEGIITARSQRSYYMGPGVDNSNINSDFAYLHLNTYTKASEKFSSLPESVQNMFKGYAAGFNYWLSQGDISAQGCADWVHTVSHVDLFALNISISYWGFIGNYIQQIGQASAGSLATLNQPIQTAKLKNRRYGSNGWAIGKDMSANKKSLLLSNTHLDHAGRFQWYEAHLSIPNKLNVYGGFLPGFITPSLGFNDSFAWTHTWSSSQPGTLYYLSAPDRENMSQYKYDDEIRTLEPSQYSISIRQADGSLIEESRMLLNSHYGPVVGLDEQGRIVVAKDAPSLDANIAEYWMQLAISKSIDEAIVLNEKGFRTGSQNIIMADSQGNTFYADMSAVPNLNDEAWQAIFADLPSYESDIFGLVLDGANSIFDWDTLVPFSDVPKRHSEEYVQNANESAWLANLSQPITAFSPLYGETHEVQSPRTRLSLAMLEAIKNRDEKMTLSDLQAAMNDKTVLLAEHTLEDLVRRCIAYPNLVIEGQNVDVSQACQVLQQWDGSADLDSAGAMLFREYTMNLLVHQFYFGCEGSCWQTPFDPLNPIATPSGLPEVVDPDTDGQLIALAKSVTVLNTLGFAPDTQLGDVQQLVKGTQSVPIAGGMGDYTGSFGTVSTTNDSPYSLSGLDENGYQINSGDGFIFMTEFTEEGPQSKSVLLYSQANSPSSPHYFDQAELVKSGRYKAVRFTPNDIKNDPNLSIEILTID